MNRLLIYLLFIPCSMLAQGNDTIIRQMKIHFTDKETKQPLQGVTDTLTILQDKTKRILFTGTGVSGPKGWTMLKTSQATRMNDYSLKACKAGYIKVLCQNSFFNGDTNALNIEMEKNKNMSGEKGGFCGEVLEKATGLPIDSAEVQLQILMNGKKDFVTVVKYTDSTGHFEFNDLDHLGDKGHYNITVGFNHKMYIWMKGWDVMPNTLLFSHNELPDWIIHSQVHKEQ